MITLFLPCCGNPLDDGLLQPAGQLTFHGEHGGFRYECHCGIHWHLRWEETNGKLHCREINPRDYQLTEEQQKRWAQNSHTSIKALFDKAQAAQRERPASTKHAAEAIACYKRWSELQGHTAESLAEAARLCVYNLRHIASLPLEKAMCAEVEALVALAWKAGPPVRLRREMADAMGFFGHKTEPA